MRDNQEVRVKCEQCRRSYECQLKRLVLLTYNYLVAHPVEEENDWERENLYLRILRGNEQSPGFTDDWIDDHAMNPQEDRKLARRLSKGEPVTHSLLVEGCKHFAG